MSYSDAELCDSWTATNNHSSIMGIAFREPCLIRFCEWAGITKLGDQDPDELKVWVDEWLESEA
jgi:hypothetical protein